MRFASLSEELDAITRDYDYGIVPGSATVFVLDEAQGLGRLDLTLLEGVMIVVEVNSQGYKVTSHSPLYTGPTTTATCQTITSHLNQYFDSMENLLMTISPTFYQRFQEALYEKLQSVQLVPQEETLFDTQFTTTTLFPDNLLSNTATTTTSTTASNSTSTTNPTYFCSDMDNSSNSNTWIY